MNKNTTQQPTIKAFRHKAEMPLLILGYVLTILITLSCVAVIALGYELGDTSYLVLGGLFAPFLGIFTMRLMYHKKLKNGVIVTDKQLPEIYQIYKELALQMGFTEAKGKNQIPPLCVVNGYGIKSFFTTKCAAYEQYIILPSDIANTVYDEENEDFAELKFVLVHKLAHIKCGHRNMKHLIIEPIMMLTFLRKPLIKAREYTADRVACYYLPNEAMTMACSHIGQNLSEHVNIDEYFNAIQDYEGSWYSKYVTLISDSIGYRRTKAIKDAQTQGWNVHGKLL